MEVYLKYLKEALDMGAVSVRVFCTETLVWGEGVKWVPFSYHFFDYTDREICYYVDDLKDIVPMFRFVTSREWSKEFKEMRCHKLFKL